MKNINNVDNISDAVHAKDAIETDVGPEAACGCHVGASQHNSAISSCGLCLSMMVLLSSALNKYIVRTWLQTAFPQNTIIVLLRSSFIIIFLSPMIFKVLKEHGFFGIQYLLRGQKQKFLESFKVDAFALQFTRSAMSCAVLALSYAGYNSLPLSVAAVIGASEPMFVAIWSLIPRRGRKASLSLIANVALSCFSVWLMSAKQACGCCAHVAQNTAVIDVSMIGVVCLVMANMICSLVPYVTMRMQKTNTITERNMNVVYNAIFGFVLMLLMNSIFYTSNLVYSYSLLISNIKYMMYFAVIGFIAMINNYVLFTVFRYIHPSIYAIIQNLSIPLLMIVGAIHGEQITSRSIFGAIVMFSSLISVIYHRRTTRDAIMHDQPLPAESKNKLNLIAFGLWSVTFCIYKCVL